MELKWLLFSGVDGEQLKPEEIAGIPGSINGIKPEAIEFAGGIYKGRKISGTVPAQGVFFSEFSLEEETVLPMGFGGCYFYRVFLNGELILDRSENGNKPYFPPRTENFIVPGFCRKGKNLLVVILKSVPEEPLCLAFKIMKEYPWQKCVPSVDNFSQLLDFSCYPAEGTPERKYACKLIQNGVLMMRNTVFNPYAADGEMEREKAEALGREYPILYFYDKALDRIINEIPTAVPQEDEIFFWHLYNMGYVIKSQWGTFGLDLNHRRAIELAPYVDFLLTTHNHHDHYDLPLFRAVSAENKKVISNFYPAAGFHRPPAELEMGAIRIVTQENDHNPALRKFVTSYYITFPNGCTVFATGDSRDVTQLDPPGKVDIFIPHPRVGLSVPEAVDKFHPGAVLYSHMLEMRHTPPTPWYAVPYDLLDEERKGVAEKGSAALAPLWGEKLVWSASVKRFI